MPSSHIPPGRQAEAARAPANQRDADDRRADAAHPVPIASNQVRCRDDATYRSEHRGVRWKRCEEATS